MELAQQSEIKFSRAGRDFVYSQKESGGKQWYLAKAIIPTPKGKWSKFKVDWYYRFPTEEKRHDYTKTYIDRIEACIKRQEEAKAAKANARKEAVNSYKVGDLFYDSWGYDQTNIDFYQVVEVGKMSVVLRAIGGRSVPGTQGMMSESVTAAKDCFLSDDHYRGKPIKSIVQVTMWGGQVGYGIRGYYKDHGYLTGTNETTPHYSSWYA